MGTGYTRNDVSNNIADGNIINASDLDGEFDAVESAFNSSTGHTHDGTAAEGGAITVVGPVQDLVVSATEVKPKTTNTLDLGTSGLLYKDAYLQGNMYFRDTALKIVSSADGQLDIDADVELELVAPTVDIDASTALTVDTASTTFTSTVFNVTGSANITGDLDVDNININGNTIISTDTNGAINITPNGTGAVNITATTNITGDLDVDNININGNTIISTDTNGDINISPDGTGTVVIDTDLDVDNINVNGNTVSSTDTNGDINLSPNGTGTVVINTDLDVDNININGNTIISTDTNGNIALTPNGTGEVDISKVDIDSGAIDGTVIGANSAAAITGTTITGTSFVTTGDMTFGDNDKAIFGAGSDLQIYHNGSASVISDTGTGNFFISGDNDVFISKADLSEVKAKFSSDGAVTLYHDGTSKFATTATGVDVTGTVTADVTRTSGANTNAFVLSDNVTGSQTSGFGTRIIGQSNSGSAISAIGFEADGGTNNDTAISFYTQPSAGSLRRRMKLGLGGDISFYDDTGVTQGLFWDASTQKLGLGVTNPSTALHVKGGTNENVMIVDATGTAANYIFDVRDDGTSKFRVDPSGKVGIGVTNPGSFYSGSNSLVAAGGISVYSTSSSRIEFVDGTSGSEAYVGNIVYDHTSNFMRFAVNVSERMRIDSSGNVGIGTTTNTTHSLFIHDSDYQQLGLSGTRPTIFLKETDGNANENYQIRLDNGNLQFATQNDAQTDSTERLRINSNGNVSLNGLSNGTLAFSGGNTADGSKIQAFNNAGNGNGYLAIEGFDKEYMRIDSSGNLLVGKTSASKDTVGAELKSDGRINATMTSGSPILVNRKTTDGDIAVFQKDGSTVGSIGAKFSGRCYIASGSSSNTGLRFDTNFVAPSDATGAGRDNAIDLGSTGARFDDVYATNGTIQTSDQNEKQQIAALTDAEMTAAKAISALFKTFKWNSAVEAKGDAARTHAGVIAQDVEAAMTAAGLDAGDYAFFISSTWWETQTEVPAVEAADAVLDEEGNVVTEAVEAVAAYTRTDTYDTAEEAPEGATERTRMGIRYPELLSFIGAATEQRLANIETRLTALEAN